MILCVIGVIAFWIGIAYIALHFILKWWYALEDRVAQAETKVATKSAGFADDTWN